eukprot:scaffold215994_cov20-Tisochrysis_lutea.AAC.1
MHATCKENTSGSFKGGIEGAEGELVASALGWGSVVLLGFGLTRSMLVIKNLQRPWTSQSLYCLLVALGLTPK